eukprot:6497127-Ditylum_brightwellii.AAC.1
MAKEEEETELALVLDMAAVVVAATKGEEWEIQIVIMGLLLATCKDTTVTRNGRNYHLHLNHKLHGGPQITQPTNE